MEKVRNLSVTEAISHIEQLSASRRTGTIFLMMDSGMVAQMVLSNGNIVNARYLRQRGLNALQSIFRTTRFRELSFLAKKSTISIRKDPELPSQDQIMAMLRRIGSVPSLPKANAISPKQGATSKKPASRSKVGSLVNPQRIIELITPELAVYLGPMAGFVCEGYFESVRTLSDAIQAIDEVAGEIDGAAESAEFKRDIKAKLQRM